MSFLSCHKTPVFGLLVMCALGGYCLHAFLSAHYSSDSPVSVTPVVSFLMVSTAACHCYLHHVTSY